MLQRAGEDVHDVVGDVVAVGGQVAEDGEAAAVGGLVGQARDEVEVHVGEALGLGELCDVGLGAAGDGVQGAGCGDLPGAQPGSFGVGEVRDRGDVPSWREDQSAR